MAEFLLVAEDVAPVADGEPALCAAALARALSAARHRVTILTLSSPDRASRLPGMARRLRTVAVRADGVEEKLSLYEGRSALSQCALYVLGSDTKNRGKRSLFLARVAASLVSDKICKPDVVLGWGECSALSLSAVPAGRSAFVLPTGRWGEPLSPEERNELDADDPAVAVSKGMLVGLGAIEADAVVLPSPSAAERLSRWPDLSFRASDQPVTWVRFGCDEAPHDPATDPALAARFSHDALSGKQECRKALARRTSLALGPRTLLLATAPLSLERGGQTILDTIDRLAREDVVVVVQAPADRALTDQAGVLTIRTPGKVAVVSPEEPEAQRQILAGADAVLFGDLDDRTGRELGLAMRYGALPIAPDVGAAADYVVDYDVASRTGCGLLYSAKESWGAEAAVLRAAGLRADAEIWRPLQESVLRAVPHWATTATLFESICLGTG